MNGCQLEGSGAAAAGRVSRFHRLGGEPAAPWKAGACNCMEHQNIQPDGLLGCLYRLWTLILRTVGVQVWATFIESWATFG